jgi:hypothetical protein
MKRIASVCALFLLIGGVALIPNAVQSAPWISGAESYAAPGKGWTGVVKFCCHPAIVLDR